ncbi:MAG: Gx transporter family protein [Lachnospiraceae bacterium]|nr:Gx transporter family protein [Lachnospiraceae bacterium]
MKTRRLVLLSLFTAFALIIFTIESAIPVILPIPGIKLGLANVVTLVILKQYGYKDAFIVLLLRIVFASLFAGQILFLFYSLAGGLASFLAMSLMNALLQNKYTVIVSIIGAIFHNFGQILAALFITGSTVVLIYLPFLLLSGLITGCFIGYVADFTSKKLRIILNDY